MSIQIKISENWFIAYDGRWKLFQEKFKESGEIKTKDFTFVSLYDILVRANQFTKLSDDAQVLLKECALSYRRSVLSFKENLKDKGKIKFSVPSVTGGPDHSSISGKHHVINIITKSSDSHLSINGYSRTQKYPGFQWQSARLIMEVEAGEILQKDKSDSILDLKKALDDCGDLVTLHVSRCLPVSDVDLVENEVKDTQEEDLEEEFIS